MGFGFDLPGEVMARVLLAPRTTAIRIAASAADGHEAGGQHRALSLELFLSGLEEAADQGGVFGYFHRFNGLFSQARYLNSIKAYQLQEEKRGLRQLFSRGSCRTQRGGKA